MLKIAPSLLSRSCVFWGFAPDPWPPRPGKCRADGCLLQLIFVTGTLRVSYCPAWLAVGCRLSEQRWGFEELDDGEYEALGNRSVAPEEADADESGLVGQDADAVVAVTVSAEGAIQTVRLAQDWRAAVDPRGLSGSVIAAVNAATMQALTEQAAEVERNPSAGQAPPVQSTAG